MACLFITQVLLLPCDLFPALPGGAASTRFRYYHNIADIERSGMLESQIVRMQPAGN